MKSHWKRLTQFFFKVKSHVTFHPKVLIFMHYHFVIDHAARKNDFIIWLVHKFTVEHFFTVLLLPRHLISLVCEETIKENEIIKVPQWYYVRHNASETGHSIYHFHENRNVLQTEVILRKLTHWGQDEINNKSQTTFSNTMSSMKMFEFRSKFYQNFVPKSPINNIFHHWFRWRFGAVQATSHYLNQWWLVYWRIYASLGLNELKHQDISTNSGY